MRWAVETCERNGGQRFISKAASLSHLRKASWKAATVACEMGILKRQRSLNAPVRPFSHAGRAAEWKASEQPWRPGPWWPRSAFKANKLAVVSTFQLLLCKVYQSCSAQVRVLFGRMPQHCWCWYMSMQQLLCYIHGLCMPLSIHIQWM